MWGFRDKRLDGLPCLTADPSQCTVLLLEGDGGGGAGGCSWRWNCGWRGYIGEAQLSAVVVHAVRERCGGVSGVRKASVIA